VPHEFASLIMVQKSVPYGWRRLVACVIGGFVFGALLVASLSIGGRSAAGSHARTPETGRAELAPDPVVVSYRFPATAGSADRADIADTIMQLEARIKHFDKSPYDYNELADNYLRRAQLDGDMADYAAAEDAARKSLAIIRNPNAGLITLAKALGARHEFREAIALANEALTQKKNAHAYNIIATDELALGELPAAAEAADAALAVKPDSGGYEMRALVMEAEGRDAEAAWDFSRAASVEAYGDSSGAAHLRALWGRFLLRRGEYAGAEIVIHEALRIAPDFPLAVAERAELALRTGHAKDAAKLFEKAFVASRQVRYLIDQARAQEVAGDRAGADGLRDQVETIVRGELEAGGFGHRLDLVEVLVDHGTKIPEAVALAREEVTRRQSAEARFQLARALARSGAQVEAMDQVQAALGTGAREAQLYELAARLEIARGNQSRAAMYTRQADRLDPDKAGWRGIGMDAR
jgi:tetratricopeptide (TPR) repeat protein